MFAEPFIIRVLYPQGPHIPTAFAPRAIYFHFLCSQFCFNLIYKEISYVH